mmetsp:Transcript_19091/g.34130  ORF Transcript_19091/g.34130 Transcript_19091/m.34130 type:complete len:790 (-) Transcript_19091:44-2413(-)
MSGSGALGSGASAAAAPADIELKVRAPTVDKANLRVVIVTACFHVVDGVTVTLRKIIKAVRSCGGKVMVLTAPPPGGLKEAGTEHLDSIPLLSCCVGQGDYSIGWCLGKDIEDKLEQFKPHVIHISTPDFACFSAAEWARNKGVPLIATWHSNIHDYLNHWGLIGSTIRPVVLSYFLSFYSLIGDTFVPTDQIRHKMIGEGFESSRTGNKLQVWGRGVDTAKFHPSKRDPAFRAKLGFEPDDVVVLWVGRCVVEKRPDVYIQVMKHLTKLYPKKVKGLVVGRGHFYKAMVAVPNCVGIGWQSADDLPKIYASSDVLCFPSRVETFGNVTLEGLASGIPVIAADCCSSHLVESGHNGYAIKGLDNSGYQEAIARLVEDSKLRQELGRNGRSRAVRQYKMEVVMDEMLNNYVNAANAPAFPAPGFHLVQFYLFAVKFLVYPYLAAHRVGLMGPVQWVVVCLFLVVSVIYIFGQDDGSDITAVQQQAEDENESSYGWMFGVALATGAQLSGALAKVLFKLYWKTKVRWRQLVISAVSYFCIIVLNPVCGLAAYSFAAQSLLAPLSILNLVWNAVLAKWILSEKLSKHNLVAYVLICSGCTMTSYFGIHTHKSFKYDELMSLFEANMFRTFIFIELIIAAVAGYVTYHGEKNHAPWMVRIAFGCLGGMMGGNQFLSKSLSEMISTALRDDISIFFSFGALSLVIGTVFVLVAGLRFLQKGLKYYTAMSLVPIYQGFFTITNVASALVFFREYELFTVNMAQAYSFALLLIFGGISQLQSPETEEASKPADHRA